MSTIEIPKSEWLHFLDGFSKQHEAEHATVQAIGDDIGAQQKANALPFVGISYDDTGSARGSITLMLGSDPDDHIEHRISDPIHLWLNVGEENMKNTLEIEGADGVKTIMQLAAPQLLSR